MVWNLYICRLSSFGMLPTMLANSNVMAVMPEGTARVVSRPLGLRVEPVPLKVPPLRMALAWHPRTDRDPPHIWFREQVKQLMLDACWREEGGCEE
uniref:Transcriptional regulator, LysR family n=1 Tax=Magnetococcus massalia (strain MO-1) TaxID=451514 RepID=A0A1S7LNH7_MAGMO